MLVLLGTIVVACANVIWPLPRMHGLQLRPDSWLMTHDSWLGHPWLLRSTDVWEMFVGVALTLVAMLLLAGRLVSEELLLRKTALHPLQVDLLCHALC